MKNLNQIKFELQQFSGTNQFYKRMFDRSVYTDGIKHLLEQAECHWLYDIIESEILTLFLKDHLLIPDIYYLKIFSKESKGRLELKDYSGKVIFEKNIPFTTFPEGHITINIGWDGERLITCLQQEN